MPKLIVEDTKTKGLKSTERKEDDRESSPRSNKSDRRSKRFHGNDRKAMVYTKGHNDLSWLLYNPDLAKVASRVPFGHPLGYDLDLFGVTNGISRILDNAAIDGICVIPSLFTAGYAEDLNSPINQAALNIWIALRRAGTGALVDDPNDVAIYFVAVGQLVAIAGWLRRVLGELTAINPLNRYFRRSLIYAEGLDYDDLAAHFSEFAFFVSWFCGQVNNFVFPKIPYFEQAYTAFHYVYKDEFISKSQVYLLTPAGFGLAEFYKSEQGSEITYANMEDDPDAMNTPGAGYTYSQLVNHCKTLLGALMNEQSVATLSAAVLKTYGEDNLWRVEEIATLHVEIEAVMDPEICMQIHNSYIYDADLEGTNNPVKGFNYKSVIPSNPNESPYLITYGSAANWVSYSAGEPVFVKPYFDMFTEVPSEGEVILASRLKVVAENYRLNNDGDTCFNITSYDAIAPLRFYRISLAQGQERHSRVYQLEESIGVPGLRENLSMFQYAPILFNYGSGDQKERILGEIHNFTVVEPRVIKDLHLNNLMSLFAVPMFK